MIKKVDGKWVIFSKDGKKKLGEFNTKKEAIAREKQIQFFKNRDKSKNFQESDSFAVPKYMQIAAKRGLEVREKQSPSNRGGTAVGIARARNLSNGDRVSLDTVKRIKSFVSRHGASYKPSFDIDSKYWQAMMLWGVPFSKDPARARRNIQRVLDWANSITDR